MPGLVGLFKELEEGEQLAFASKDSLPLVLVKELVIKRLLGSEHREQPLVYAMASLYLTNKRMILLALHQAESGALIKQGAPKAPLRSGAWLVVPIKAISSAEPRLIDVRRDRELLSFMEWARMREEAASGHAPALEVVYDCEQAVGGVADYIKLISEMGILARDQRKVETQADKLLLFGEEAASNALPSLKEAMKGAKPARAARSEPLL